MLVHIIFVMLNKEPKNAKHAALRNEDKSQWSDFSTLGLLF